jgi:hypothetical protein
MLRYQFTNSGEEVLWNIHDRNGFNFSLVLGQRRVFILSFVMGEYALNFLVIPSQWGLVLAHGCFFFLRLR